MNIFIQQRALKLINFLLCFCVIFSAVACNDKVSPFASYPQGDITLPSGKVLKLYVADTGPRQVTGLSGTKANEFEADETLIFLGKKDVMRNFWMPDTYFNIDIIYLTAEFYVLDIQKNVQHFIGREPQYKIPKAKPVYCRHVLEIKADSPFAKEITPGMTLKINIK